MLPRDGVQLGDVQWQRRNSTACLTNVSKFGVLTTLSPRQLACGQDQSSATITSTLGRGSGLPACALAGTPAQQARATNVSAFMARHLRGESIGRHLASIAFSGSEIQC